MRKSQISDDVTAQELGAILGVSDRTIRNHASAGTITRTASGRYPLGPSIRSLIAEAKKSKTVNGLSKEQEAIAAGKRRLLELRLAKEEGALIDLTDALDAVSEIVGAFRAGLDGLPARLTRNREDRKRIKMECDALLVNAAKKFKQLQNGMTFDEAEKFDDDE